MRVMLSPFKRMRPNSSLDPSFVDTSTASSTTMFMNSSNPRTLPWILSCVCSYSHIVTTDCCCKYLKIKLMGGSMDFLLLTVDMMHKKVYDRYMWYKNERKMKRTK